MKSIAESMHNFDRENFQRVAAGLPEMQDEQAVKRRAAKTAEIFNELFRQLLAVFPALASKTPEEMNEMRRQWLPGVQGKRDCLHGANQRRNARCPQTGSPIHAIAGSVCRPVQIGISRIFRTAGCSGAGRYGLPVLPDPRAIPGC